MSETKQMKNFLILVVALSLSAVSHAQDVSPNVGPGTWQVSGGGRFSTQGVSNEAGDVSKYQQISLASRTEYFVTDSWAVGGSLGYSFYKAPDFSLHGFSIGPSASYYFYQSERHLTGAHAGIQYALLGDSDWNSSMGFDNGLSYQLAGSYDYFLTNTIALGVDFGFNLQNGKSESFAHEFYSSIRFAFFL